LPGFTGNGSISLGVAAPFANRNGIAVAGALFILSGGPAIPPEIDLGGGGPALVGFDGGDTKGQIRSSVASAGDLNGHGSDDLLVGEYLPQNSAYLIQGPPGGPLPPLSRIDKLPATKFALGYKTAGIGDGNGDGYSDFLVTQSATDVEGRG